MLTFSIGTYTEATAAALGATIQNKIRDDLVIHPAWELVEEFTPGGGAVNWLVMRCLSSVSGLIQDYYAVFGRVIATGEIRMFICEQYNTGTKVCSYYSPYYGGTAFVYDALGRCPNTYTLGTTAPAVSGSITSPAVQRSWTPAAATIKMWIIVDDDGFTVGWNGSPNFFWHVSSYIPLATLKSDLPISMHGQGSGGSGPDGGLTRNPALAGAVGAITPAGLGTYGGGTPLYSVYTPTIGINPGQNMSSVMLYNDKLNDNKRGWLNEIGISMYANPDSNWSVYGFFLGKHKPRFRGIPSNPPNAGSILWGDTWAFNGTLWVQYLNTDPRIWDTGVAA